MTFVLRWLPSWVFAWIALVPIVIIAAPAIQALVRRIAEASK